MLSCMVQARNNSSSTDQEMFRKCACVFIITSNGHMSGTWLIPHGLVVRIPAFHAGGPGSIPGVGARPFCELMQLSGLCHIC